MWVAQCLRCLSLFVPSLLLLKAFLRLTFTLTHPPLFSYRGVHQSGTMDHWKGEKQLHVVQNPSMTLGFVCNFSFECCPG